MKQLNKTNKKTEILANLSGGLETILESQTTQGLTRYHGADGIVRFVVEILGATPTPYQEEILRAFATHRRVAVRAPHGAGKSCVSSWCICWLMTVFDTDVKVVTTAGAWRQVEKFLWPEVRKWASNAKWEKVGIKIRYGQELLNLSLRLPNKEAFAAVSDQPDLIEGAHATIVGYIFDESKSIPDETFDAAEGAFSQDGLGGHAAYALAISTPGEMLGRFYDIHARKPGLRDWWTKHITLQEAIAAGQISQEWADNRKAQWGEESEVYQRRVLGEFASSGESTVIPLSWVEAAQQRWYEWNEGTYTPPHATASIGCDPARFGEDKTVVAQFQDYVVTELERMSKMDTMAIANYLATLDPLKVCPMGIDVIGLGAGVVDRLRELEYPVFGINTSEVSSWTDVSGELNFLNLRSALWWLLREYLDPSKPRQFLIALPVDDTLMSELITPKWNETQRGLIKVESKDDIRKRLSGKSTDSADAVLLALYASLVGSSHGIWV